MFKTSISNTTIILLVVTLVVGLGGGYLVSSSTLQPKIDDLNEQVTDKSNQITTLNTQITNKDAIITQLNTTISNLQSQVKGQSSQIYSLIDTIKGKDYQISVLNDRITSSPGFLGVNLYGFSFEYPMNLTMSVVGFTDTSANSNSGIIKMIKSDSEQFSLMYIHRTVAPDIDASIDTAKAAMVPYNPQYSPRLTTFMNGYTMKYERFTATDSNGVFFGIIGYVYCSELNYYFAFSGGFYDGAQTTLVFDHLLHSLYLPH
jgi:uncharacterized coiled-coil protein SlyX